MGVDEYNDQGTNQKIKKKKKSTQVLEKPRRKWKKNVDTKKLITLINQTKQNLWEKKKDV